MYVRNGLLVIEGNTLDLHSGEDGAVPSGSTRYGALAHLGERYYGIVEVAGA